ncbi:MAG: hypothetical protein LBL09_01270 [Oscillospiraceae bacterium]|nr:hypothetical protein [Oscillospiraceae bacterium]
MAGNYYVTWWVAVDGTAGSADVSFAVDVDGSPYSTGSMPIVTGQVSGSALVTVGATPATISLINVSGNTIALAGTPVQANIVILETAI